MAVACPLQAVPQVGFAENSGEEIRCRRAALETARYPTPAPQTLFGEAGSHPFDSAQDKLRAIWCLKGSPIILDFSTAPCMAELMEKSMSESHANGSRIVSVCGKGGAGKTAITAMMARALADSGRAGKLLVIDADPALGQLSALGAKAHRTMGQIREEIIRTAQQGHADAKAELAAKLDYMVFEALNETDRFALLAMGRAETLGCYCSVNSLLRGAIEKLSESFDMILVDGEAGLEQINRQVVRRLDTLLIVSDPTSRGMQTAAVIKHMVEDEKIIECKKVGLVFNRVIGNQDLLRQSAARIGIEVFGFIPHDQQIAEYDLVARPIIELPADSPAQSAVGEIVESWVLAQS